MEKMFYYCPHCGNIISMVKDSGVKVHCCGEEMKPLIAGVTDGAKEKHVPIYEVVEESIIVKVQHPMEDVHYIEWIACISEGRERIKYFKPGDEPEGTFKHKTGSLLYAYCNNDPINMADPSGYIPVWIHNYGNGVMGYTDSATSKNAQKNPLKQISIN